ncbi:hypothetical protein BDW02DRAFT_143021 [Decorospora gaudefroyi]|uniref:Uncharacterized protein n=1 Tax=Decorospora gaudefroyi TaxID=184978 RepID=A0A6A5JZB7_9PLEO|nr:hypothetical protein BDW02DRAFT_143021 [Decorospora gaudefroyi]
MDRELGLLLDSMPEAPTPGTGTEPGKKKNKMGKKERERAKKKEEEKKSAAAPVEFFVIAFSAYVAAGELNSWRVFKDYKAVDVEAEFSRWSSFRAEKAHGWGNGGVENIGEETSEKKNGNGETGEKNPGERKPIEKKTHEKDSSTREAGENETGEIENTTENQTTEKKTDENETSEKTPTDQDYTAVVAESSKQGALRETEAREKTATDQHHTPIVAESSRQGALREKKAKEKTPTDQGYTPVVAESSRQGALREKVKRKKASTSRDHAIVAESSRDGALRVKAEKKKASKSRDHAVVVESSKKEALPTKQKKRQRADSMFSPEKDDARDTITRSSLPNKQTAQQHQDPAQDPQSGPQTKPNLDPDANRPKPKQSKESIPEAPTAEETSDLALKVKTRITECQTAIASLKARHSTAKADIEAKYQRQRRAVNARKIRLYKQKETIDDVIIMIIASKVSPGDMVWHSLRLREITNKFDEELQAMDLQSEELRVGEQIELVTIEAAALKEVVAWGRMEMGLVELGGIMGVCDLLDMEM